VEFTAGVALRVQVAALTVTSGAVVSSVVLAARSVGVDGAVVALRRATASATSCGGATGPSPGRRSAECGKLVNSGDGCCRDRSGRHCSPLAMEVTGTRGRVGTRP
jgi:hypothetical protein